MIGMQLLEDERKQDILSKGKTHTRIYMQVEVGMTQGYDWS
jgi:hypothetical protein